MTIFANLARHQFWQEVDLNNLFAEGLEVTGLLKPCVGAQSLYIKIVK